jgi:short subunit dehydrogenase-like uncharacterized protein
MSMFAMQVSKKGRASVEVNVPQPADLRDPTWSKLVHGASMALLNNLAFQAWRVWFQGRVRKLLPAAGAGPERVTKARGQIQDLVGKLTYGSDARVLMTTVKVLDVKATGLEWSSEQLEALRAAGMVVLEADDEDDEVEQVEQVQQDS